MLPLRMLDIAEAATRAHLRKIKHDLVRPSTTVHETHPTWGKGSSSTDVEGSPVQHSSCLDQPVVLGVKKKEPERDLLWKSGFAYAIAAFCAEWTAAHPEDYEELTEVADHLLEMFTDVRLEKLLPRSDR